MKLLVVLALVAAAYAAPEAEANADPAYYYRGWGGYARPYGYGWGYGRPYGWGYRGYWKREADAEPNAEAAPTADAEAEPWYYSHWYGARAYSPYYWGGYRYAYSPYYYNRWGGYWKREAGEEEPTSGPNADASPEADPEAYWYGAYGRRWGGWGYGYRPYGWGYGYRGYRWW